MENLEISIILPCQNEERTLLACLRQIKKVIKENKLSAEIIVSDSSTDQSPKIAESENVILVKHDRDGYGSAYLEALKIAKGKYIFMADADGTYDFSEIPNFIRELKNNNDLVLGDRFRGEMENGAMPALNKHLGNPVLSFILRLFFHANIKDSQSGMRAIKRESLEKLNLKTTGMEFASEMIIKSIRKSYKIKELPINYMRRGGVSKLRPFSDAWKHVRFMLLYSPLFLFFIPGLVLFSLGFIAITWLYFDSPNILGIKLYYHPMFFASALMVIGYQLIIFAVFAKSYAINHLGERSDRMDKLYKHITIEKASLAGITLGLAGIMIYSLIVLKWVGGGFPALNEIKNSIVGLTLIILGTQTIFSSFMLSILSIKEK